MRLGRWLWQKKTTAKEMLALVFAVKKFDKFLYERQFILLTHYTRVLSIYRSKRAFRHVASHLHRCATTFLGYDFDIKFLTSAKRTTILIHVQSPIAGQRQYHWKYFGRVCCHRWVFWNRPRNSCHSNWCTPVYVTSHPTTDNEVRSNFLATWPAIR